jgi:hypothetical protein
MIKPLVLGLLGQTDQPRYKKTSKKKSQTFQEKHKNKIEDADYEDLDG